MSAAPQREVLKVLVQTAKSLPAVDSGWTTHRYVRFESGSDGCGQILGDALLVQDTGIVKPADTTTFASIGLAPDISRAGLVDDLVGLLVRLLQEDSAGTVTIEGETYTAIWWGRITQQTLNPDLADSVDTGGHATWQAVGIGAVLDDIVLRGGFVRSTAGVAVDPGYLPRFNAQPGGDRSASTVTVNGAARYVHQLSDTTSGNMWTAKQIFELLLSGAATPFVHNYNAYFGWSWSLNAIDNCLDYQPEDLDLDGMTLHQAVNALANPRRGLTWTLSVSGATVTITVRSASATAVSGGSFTLPASTKVASLDAAGSPWLTGLEIQQDEAGNYDVIEVRGGHPWTGLTLVVDGSTGSLRRDWDPGLEAAWEANPSHTLYERVGRRFVVASDWDETGEGGGSLNNSLLATASGLTGARQATLGYDLISGYVHEGERMLPCSTGFSTLLVGQRQPPVVVIKYGSTYEDVSLRWKVEVIASPLTVVLDDGADGVEIMDLLGESGAKIYVSIGVREHQPLRVSWQRDLADWPLATPRVKMIHIDGIELWRIAVGTVKGTNVAGSALSSATEFTLRDDTDSLNDVLALARARFGVPTYRARWVSRGVMDTSTTYAPGTILTSVTLGDRTYGIYALITRRSWTKVERDGVEMWDTVFETEQAGPELEAVL